MNVFTRWIFAGAVVICAPASSLGAGLSGVGQAMVMVGATPEALAASGAESDDFAAITNALRANPSAIDALITAIHQRTIAKRELKHLRSEGRRTGIDGDAESSLAQAELAITAANDSLASATASVQEIINTTMSSRLGPESMTVCLRFHSNASRNVPTEFRVLELDDTGWSLLERAFAREAANEPLSNAEAEALVAARSSPLVAVVAVRLDANVGSMAQAFAVTMAQ
ncbi:MAG: hypothetical protein H6813_06665 [Phycisphaeraceae bacterium]|nr:hypothetical protein [Phycisphaeraceae bacterium]MCB9848153.1 hypothetical protein [Phycisphaeraceae bacterium]